MLLARKNYYLLRIFNYVIVIVFLILLNVEGKVDIYLELVLALLYILNSQLRLFTLEWTSRKGKIAFLLSIFLECILIVFLFKLLDVQLLVFLYIVILDLVLYIETKVALTFIGGIGLLSIFFEFTYTSERSLDRILFHGITFIAYTILGIFLKEEAGKKKRAQYLYDRVRRSEEKLMELNKDLELYSNTVEELTLLRERARVSRELHDSVGHSLSTLSIQLRAIKMLINKEPKIVEKMLETNIEFTKNALENVRRTVRELKPLEFEAYEGMFIIEELVKKFSKLTGIDVKLILSKEKCQLTAEQSQHLYHIIQESLNNAVRHGQAKNISISIQFLKEKLYLRIKDDGKGSSSLTPSFGLKGIEERIKKLKGTIEFYTELEKGFEMTITLPIFNEIDNSEK